MNNPHDLIRQWDSRRRFAQERDAWEFVGEFRDELEIALERIDRLQAVVDAVQHPDFGKWTLAGDRAVRRLNDALAALEGPE